MNERDKKANCTYIGHHIGIGPLLDTINCLFSFIIKEVKILFLVRVSARIIMNVKSKYCMENHEIGNYYFIYYIFVCLEMLFPGILSIFEI